MPDQKAAGRPGRALLDTLARLPREGSLSQAARAIGRSPAHVTREVARWEDLTGEDLVATRKGGTGGGGGATLTDAGRRFLARYAGGAEADGFENAWSGNAGKYDPKRGVTPVHIRDGLTLHVAGRVSEGPAVVTCDATDVALSALPAATRALPGASQRNRFEAMVRSVRPGKPEGCVRVRLESGSARVEAVVTKDAANELGLRTGRRVSVVLKATALRVP